MTFDEELQNLLGRQTRHREPLTVRLLVECRGNAKVVMDRLRSVLQAVVEANRMGRDDPEYLRAQLPDWFVNAFASPLTDDEAAAYVARWSSLDEEAQRQLERSQPWSFLDWQHWMSSENRPWRIVEADTVDDSQIVMRLSVEGWPVPLEALEWAVRACGATRIEVVA